VTGPSNEQHDSNQSQQRLRALWNQVGDLQQEIDRTKSEIKERGLLLLQLQGELRRVKAELVKAAEQGQ
jgi:peptidoglycan hydrolase CwlO-like protein